ncbi:MAG: glycosyltransferase family 4 protein [Vicinamibacterales bacterium]
MTLAAPVALAVLVLVGVSAWALTGWLRRYALTRQLMDVPNARSSHRVATPRGGGGSIVIASTLALAWWAWAGDSPALAGVLAGGLIVAGVGFLDDHRPVPPIVRLVGHSIAAGLAVSSLDAASAGSGQSSLMPGIAGDAIAVFLVVWLINLTNFMDGIDGIAGVQAVTICAVGSALTAVTSPETGHWIEPAVLGAASIGFLVWNWPPARVFMGDVGSGYVGFMVAVLTLRSISVAPVLGWCWLILSGVFMVDATLTLACRAARGDRLFEAHRCHAYQHLALARGHRAVTLLVAAINLCWLTPVAAFVAFGYITGVTGLLVAYVPLAMGAARCGAGSASRP